MATPKPLPESTAVDKPIDKPSSNSTSKKSGPEDPPKAAAGGKAAPLAKTVNLDILDMETFGQLLEMDDDDEHSFSKLLTLDYFDQAVTTFKEMDKAVESRDLQTLSRKGHFLKGSSAALGLKKVKESCEKMQHYGNKKTADGKGTLSAEEAEEKCRNLLVRLKKEQEESKIYLEGFFRMKPGST